MRNLEDNIRFFFNKEPTFWTCESSVFIYFSEFRTYTLNTFSSPFLTEKVSIKLLNNLVEPVKMAVLNIFSEFFILEPEHVMIFDYTRWIGDINGPQICKTSSRRTMSRRTDCQILSNKSRGSLNSCAGHFDRFKSRNL
jgi:hypothetical protein